MPEENMPDEDYDFMDVDVDSAKALATVPAGETYRLRIDEVRPNAEKRYVLVLLRIVEHEFTKRVRHFLSYPKEEDDAEKVNNKLLMLKNFFLAFEIPRGEKNPQTFVGHEGWAILDETDDPTYGQQNSFNPFNGLVIPGSAG